MTLTPEMQQQLEQLKDIHLPEPISWFPLAIGWWIVLTILLVTILLVVGVYLGKHRRVKKQVFVELQRLPDETPAAFATELSVLLRRVAIFCHDEDVAQLSGTTWVDFLTAGKHGLSPEFAVFIANAPYDDSAADCDLSALRQAARHWIVVRLKQRKPLSVRPPIAQNTSRRAS